MVGLPFQKQHVPKTASEEEYLLGHSSSKNTFEATQHLMLSGVLADDGHQRKLQKFDAKNLDSILGRS